MKWQEPGFQGRHVTVQVGMVRDWAGIYLRKANELAGTPEGAEALAHSKRYAQLANTMAALSIEVDALRAALDKGGS